MHRPHAFVLGEPPGSEGVPTASVLGEKLRAGLYDEVHPAGCLGAPLGYKLDNLNTTFLSFGFSGSHLPSRPPLLFVLSSKELTEEPTHKYTRNLGDSRLCREAVVG